MTKRIKEIRAMPRPDGKGHQISYEIGNSRRIHQFVKSALKSELPPHSAGSFHNPQHHHDLMDRLQNYLQSQE